MKNKMINQEAISGWLYQHDLEEKVVQNERSENYGKKYIQGTIDIATDEEGLNVIPIEYVFETPTRKNGAENRNYTTLRKIMNEGKTWIEHGRDEATCLKVSTALDLNEFYTANDQLVSQKVNRGGFISIVNEPDKDRASFNFDMVITKVDTIEPDEDHPRVEAPYVNLHGGIFNYRNDLLPIDVVVENESGRKYFEDLDISNANPYFSKIWGKIVSNTETYTKTEESAFGEAAVKVYERKVKKWVVTGTIKTPYDFGDENFLTAEELTKKLQDREIKLAEIKRKKEEYQVSKANVPSPAMTTPVAAVPDFNF